MPSATTHRPENMAISQAKALSTRRRSCAMLCKARLRLRVSWSQPRRWWPSDPRRKQPIHRCPVAAWEGWTTKHNLHEDSEWAAAGNCWAAQSYSATERGINVLRASAQALTRPATSHSTLLTDWSMAFLPPVYDRGA